MPKSWDRSRDRRFPSDAELVGTILDIRRDALAILPMYHRLHSLGLEPARGDSVHASGSGTVRPDGSETGYVPELAIESAHAAGRREYAKWVGSELAAVAKRLDRVRQGLEHNIGPMPGYRQPQALGSNAIVSVAEFKVSLENQAQRLRHGGE